LGLFCVFAGSWSCLKVGFHKEIFRSPTTCSKKGPNEFHNAKDHSIHLGSRSELLHRLAEDVKLSAHGRHPTVYPFNFVVTVIFLFIFVSWIIFGFSLQRQTVRSVQVWGCAIHHTNPTSSLASNSGQLVPYIPHWGQCSD
jgi:hypothetical protein